MLTVESNTIIKEPLITLLTAPLFLASSVCSFNNKFTDRMRRIKVPLPPVDEKKKVIEDVDKDRKHAIDAAIVRTMKSRKVLQHQQLVMEVRSFSRCGSY